MLHFICNFFNPHNYVFHQACNSRRSRSLKGKEKLSAQRYDKISVYETMSAFFVKCKTHQQESY